jgi:CMP-N-acetylneuraminic acid synthetase
LDFRAPDEAGDTVKIFDYLKDKREKIFAGRNGAFVLALPTVPLRRAHHFNEAIELFETTQRPVFSATNYGFPISFAFHMDEMRDWSPVFSDTPMVTGNTRSQNQQDAYHPNGAIYVRAIDDLAQPELMTLYADAVPYLMSRIDSVDIDGEIDFKMAAALF